MIGRLAVTSVSQADAERYCAWRYPGGRLPTESEWEWAARGPGQALYPWGDAFKAECVVSGLGPAARVQLGGSRPCGDTASGLHDLSGNVWEWTGTRASLYGPGPAPEAGAFVVRGGSYQSQDPAELTATSRQFRAAPSPSIGFRCAVGRTP
jgi:formylglycine-generating enzyme required for sulfatase activity